MGGNALTKPSVRLPASRYYEVERELVAQIRSICSPRRAESILSYASKPDFGDMDILIEGGTGYNPYDLAHAMGATEIVRNGDVTSLGIALTEGVFQVDLIKTTAESFDFASRYFAYNDMGNLIGRVAHKFGAKFGHHGLWYPVRDPANDDHLIGELLITNNFDQALVMLGYDAALYEQNRLSNAFESIEDIFRYVISSPYINPDIFLLDNRNNVSRTRDAKRPTYTKFLQWLRDGSVPIPTYQWGEAQSQLRTRQKNDFLTLAKQVSPTFANEYKSLLVKHNRQKLVRQHFNGEIVGNITGLTGKDLGIRMRQIRDSFASHEEFEQFFLEATQLEINNKICNPGVN